VGSWVCKLGWREVDSFPGLPLALLIAGNENSQGKKIQIVFCPESTLCFLEFVTASLFGIAN